MALSSLHNPDRPVGADLVSVGVHSNPVPEEPLLPPALACSCSSALRRIISAPRRSASTVPFTAGIETPDQSDLNLSASTPRQPDTSEVRLPSDFAADRSVSAEASNCLANFLN